MNPPQVITVKLRLSNAFLVLGARPLLVDSGAPGEEGPIVQALARHSLNPQDLSLVLHTHVHSDHVGSTVALVAGTSVPVAFHAADELLAHQGNNGKLTGTGLSGRLMAGIFGGTPFEAPRPNFFLEDSQRLDDYGVAGRVLHTPGHTAGSVSVILDSGEAIVGDTLMGGFLGGAFLPDRPSLHYFAEDLAQLRRSLQMLLAQPVHTLHVGHGGPLSVASVRRSLPRLARLWST